MSHTLFVYGTLKRGFRNHSLLAHCEFLGTGRTREKYCLKRDNGVPFVLSRPALSQIIGEVYRVDDTTLDKLDILEKHPTWYERRTIAIVYENHHGRSATTSAWVYFNDSATGIALPSGVFSP